MATYFKIANADGWDRKTGHTINYRENVGRVVRVPEPKYNEPAAICTDTVLHASKDVLDALKYAGIPCTVFRVSGKAVVKQEDKLGFKELKVLEEIPEAKFDELLGFRYREALHPFDPRTVTVEKVGSEEFEELRVWGSVLGSVLGSVRDSVWGSVRGSVRGSVWDSVRGSVWDSVGGSLWDSVWDSVRDSVRDSEAAYMGSLFTGVKTWKYTEKVTVKGYPFQSCVNLIRKGLIPATDGQGKWYLCHPIDGKPAQVMWEGVLAKEAAK
jgi:hypothetical protein